MQVKKTMSELVSRGEVGDKETKNKRAEGWTTGPVSNDTDHSPVAPCPSLPPPLLNFLFVLGGTEMFVVLLKPKRGTTTQSTTTNGTTQAAPPAGRKRRRRDDLVEFTCLGQ